jgi:ribosomal protein L16 Arg81 hydroxylase
VHTNFDLARLIQPVTPEAFVGEYYERQPLRVSRNDPDYFDGLLTLAQLDSVLSVASVREPDLRVVNAGTAIGINELSPSGPGSASGKLELLYARFREGATIGLQALHERWPPLKQLSRALAVDLSARIQTNVYLTPSNGEGLRLHYDTHDVFVLQTVGRKRWQLFGMGATLPGRSQPYQPGVDPGEPDQEFILEQGDSLYIPRGWLHQAFGCEQELSVHITAGVHPVIVQS